MKKYKRSVNAAGLLGFIRINRSFVMHYIVFSVSFLFGVFTVLFGFAFKDGSFSDLLTGVSDSGYLATFLSYFLLNTIAAVLILIFSFFAFGAPLAEILFSVFGLGVGCSFASVCRAYDLKGILINAVVFLIPSLMMFYIYVFLMSASASVSNGFAVIAFGRRTVNDMNIKVKDMLIMFLISEFIIAFVSALRSLLILTLPVVFSVS